ncbi:hypothetical protein [Nostoc commune]|uniref:hypothetical protein n=1 Tax=Nostoc commune TaxID=1178 RepID=UPI0018C576B9|nr:hypothetical protein [Nostoc commune]MBG1262903.1 hypothetical protein [Nostoc commune BAE]
MGDRLRTVEIWRSLFISRRGYRVRRERSHAGYLAIAIFNEPQRRRGHRTRRERSHTGDFAGDRSFQRTTETQRTQREEEGDRTLEILQAIAFLSHAEEEESDRTMEILQAIAFLSHAEEEESDRTMEILQAIALLVNASKSNRGLYRLA